MPAQPPTNNPFQPEDSTPLHGKPFPSSFPFSHLIKRLTTKSRPLSTPPVLDLPQLHTKPPASVLLTTLSQLTITPTPWNLNPNSEDAPRSINEDGLPSYLTRIISSSLAWITSEEEREGVWEAASARLAERSGRSAAPSRTRVFTIPTFSSNSSSHDMPEEEKKKTIDITIHEPSLTGDNLGHKTWVASYLLAKRLPELLLQKSPWFLVPQGDTKEKQYTNDTNQPPTTSSSSPLRILELGAGTGLVGLSLAATLSTITSTPLQIHLTDLPSIVPNLIHNIHLNKTLIRSTTVVTAGVLDWSVLEEQQGEEEEREEGEEGKERYDIILAADSLYMADHASWLAATMNLHLSTSNTNARIYVELPFRTATEEETDDEFHTQYKQEMAKHAFEISSQGTEHGHDDWTHGTTGENLPVKCWWSVWKRSHFNPCN